MLLAAGLLVLSAVIVYLGRHGYLDTAHLGQPLSVLASVYYATVTLSTTGYGDIVPVSDTARLVNTFLITPIRVVFLIVLVGTTLEVLTERTRMNWADHPVEGEGGWSGGRRRLRVEGPGRDQDADRVGSRETGHRRHRHFGGTGGGSERSRADRGRR